MRKPLAILHVLYQALGEIEYPIGSHWELDAMISIADGWPNPNRFYIEWLDKHNGRTTTPSSEVPSE